MNITLKKLNVTLILKLFFFLKYNIHFRMKRVLYIEFITKLYHVTTKKMYYSKKTKNVFLNFAYNFY